MKAFLIKIEALQEHKGVGYQHDGEEFVYVLSGNIEIAVGDHINTLKKGESLHFNSGIKHKLKNIGKKNAELVVVVYSISVETNEKLSLLSLAVVAFVGLIFK